MSVAGVVGIASGVAAFVTVPGTLELLFFAVGSIAFGWRRARTPAAPGDRPERLKIAALVPAHDEQGQVGACVASLRACEPFGAPFQVVVVADNCGDGTADAARRAGARVIERADPDRRGKGYALARGFDTLMAEGVDLVAVVDADSIVSRNFIVAMGRAVRAGASAVQCRYVVGGSRGGCRDRLLRLGMGAFNVVRPRARSLVGLSAGIHGNGFGLTRTALEAVPFNAHSLVEDLEYHLQLVRHGVRVAYLDDAQVTAPMPPPGEARRSQRARWEGGRLQAVRTLLPAVLRDLVAGRERRLLIEPALELMLPPLAWHVVILLLTLAAGPPAVRGMAVTGLSAAVLYVLSAAHAMRRPADLVAVLWAPFYLCWKLALVPRVFRQARPGAPWVRTGRAARKRPGSLGAETEPS